MVPFQKFNEKIKQLAVLYANQCSTQVYANCVGVADCLKWHSSSWQSSTHPFKWLMAGFIVGPKFKLYGHTDSKTVTAFCEFVKVPTSSTQTDVDITLLIAALAIRAQPIESFPLSICGNKMLHLYWECNMSTSALQPFARYLYKTQLECADKAAHTRMVSVTGFGERIALLP